MTIETTIAPAPVSRRSSRPRAPWLVPTALIVLSLIPVIAGALRLTELAGGPGVLPEAARFQVFPIPVITHIVAATTYSILGAFQFVPALRRKPWHRVAGRVLMPAGMLVALTGMWMAVFQALPEGDTNALVIIRLLVGSAMAGSIIMGFLAIRRRDFVRHGAWMTRAYALAVAAGTQALVSIPWLAAGGADNELSRVLLLGAGWLINIVVAEYIIYRRTHRSARTSRTSGRSGTSSALLS